MFLPAKGGSHKILFRRGDSRFDLQEGGNPHFPSPPPGAHVWLRVTLAFGNRFDAYASEPQTSDERLKNRQQTNASFERRLGLVFVGVPRGGPGGGLNTGLKPLRKLPE